MNPSISQQELKKVFKEALVEVLEEQQDMLQNAIEDALEDVAFIRAIKEGETSQLAERQEVFEILGKKQ